MKRFLLFAGALLALSIHSASIAATSIFLNLDGVLGESTVRGHENEIDVFSFSWGLSSTVSRPGGGAGAGRPTFAEATWTQGLDRSVPAEFLGVASGRTFRRAEFEFVRPADAQGRTFASFLFEDVILTSLNLGFSSTTTPLAALALAYSRVTLEYRRQRPDGSLDAPIQARWDLRTGSSFAESFSGDPAALMGMIEAGALSVTPNGITFTTAVPEPSTYALMLAGLVVVGSIARTRKRRQ